MKHPFCLDIHARNVVHTKGILLLNISNQEITRLKDTPADYANTDIHDLSASYCAAILARHFCYGFWS